MRYLNILIRLYLLLFGMYTTAQNLGIIETKLFYDKAYRIIETQHQNCSYTTYNYDKDGNRIQKKDVYLETSIGTSNSSCDLNNGEIEVYSNPGSNYQYKWSNGQNGTKISNLAPGKYSVSISDLINTNNYYCVKEAEVGKKPNPITEAKITPLGQTTFCQNDSVKLKASTGQFHEYIWYKDGVSFQFGFDSIAKVFQTGSYTVKILNDGCEKVSAPILIIVNLLPKFTINSNISPPIFCEPDSALLYPSINGKIYKWSTNQNTKNIYVKSSGKYLLTLTDSNQCSNSSSIDILVNKRPKVVANASKLEVCYDDTVRLFGTGANTYIWDKGVVNNIPFKPNNSLRYNLTGIDLNNCQDTASIFIQVNELPNLSITAHNIKCYGVNDGEIHIIGENGKAPYQFSINSNNYKAPSDYFNLPKGNYNVSVKDSKGCISPIIPVPILELVTELKANISQSNVKCNGASTGQFTVQPSGGTFPYLYALNNGAFISNNSYSNLKAGIYDVQIKDYFGCIITKSITITEPPILQIPDITTLFVKCFGGNDGSILIEGQGGTPPYRYSLNGGGLTANNNFRNLIAGQYPIRVVDANDCIVDYSTTVNEPSKVITSIEYQTPDDCFPIGTGTIKVNALGGIGNKLYSINNGNTYQNSGIFNNLAKGNYSILTKDENNCESTLPITILQTNPINNLVITIQNAKLISPYNDPNRWYEIGNTISLGTGKEFTCTHGSVYYVIGTDINGCEARSENLLYNCITNLKDPQDKLLIDIYPNPSSGLLTLKFNNAETGLYNLTLYSSDGKEMKNFQMNVNNPNYLYELNCSNLITGIYFIKIEHGQVNIFKPISIIK